MGPIGTPIGTPVVSYGWGGTWIGAGNFTPAVTTPLGFFTNFVGGNLLKLVASGAQEGGAVIAENVGEIVLGYPLQVGAGFDSGMQNFDVRVGGDIGRFVGRYLLDVSVYATGDVGFVRIAQSSNTIFEVGGNTGTVSLLGSFSTDLDLAGDVGAVRSGDSFFTDITVQGDVTLLVDRNGLGNDYSLLGITDVTQIIGGGFHFLFINDLATALLVRNSDTSVVHISDTEVGARIRLEGGAGNVLDLAHAGDGTLITVVGGDNNQISVGDGHVRYAVLLNEAAAGLNPNVTILGGDDNEVFRVSGNGTGGWADLAGGAGNDTFVFNLGTQATVQGDEGRDTFIYRGGDVMIEDFVLGQDRLFNQATVPTTIEVVDNLDGTSTVHITDTGLWV